MTHDVAAALAALDLTKDERSYLAMHAYYEAERQLDPRRYTTSEVDEHGAQRLSVDWATREERQRRWRAVADALHPEPIWPGGSR